MDALSHSGVSCNFSTGIRSCLHDFRCAESPSKSSSLISIYFLTSRPSLQGFVSGITNCATLLPVKYFIVVQLIVFLPLALVRDLAKLSSTALIADGFILVGLLYIFGSEFQVIAQRGIADVKLFNPKDFALFIGTAVFSFEGIGLVCFDKISRNIHGLRILPILSRSFLSLTLCKNPINFQWRCQAS